MASAPSKAVLRGTVAAQELRLEQGLGIEPLVELWSFIRDLDLDLAFHDFDDDGPDGLYHWNGRRGLIVVNSSKRDVARQRFTAAHELGHHLLHGGRLGSPLDVVDADVFSNENEAEREANAFAATLLMPDAAMKTAFSEKDRKAISAEDVAELMHRFGTSFQTTVYRLHNAARILAEDRDRLLDEGYGRVNWLMRAKGYDREELLPGQDLPPEYVVRVLDMCRGGTIDSSRAAELLRRPIAEVESLLETGDAEDRGIEELRDILGEDLGALLTPDAGVD